MTVRRLVSILSVCLVAGATVVSAQPKKDAKKKAPAKAPAKPVKPPVPAPGSGATPTPAGPGSAGSGAGSGSEVAPIEDSPPADMEGKDENPDAPRTTDTDTPAVVVPVKQVRVGYPVEESLRPITMPQNMSEISISPHAMVSPYMGADALRARYGITRQVQIGLTYVFAGIYDDPATDDDKLGFHPGKAVGLDVTVLLKDWVGVKVGVPFYIDPVAFSLALGAPMKFQIMDKLAIGGLDDVVNIKLSKFAPTFYQEFNNAAASFLEESDAAQSRGTLRFAAYGIYQYQPKLAVIGRFGVDVENFSTRQTNSGGSSGGGLTSFLRLGINYTPRPFLDVGFSLGFDDLSFKGSFGPAGFFAFRI